MITSHYRCGCKKKHTYTNITKKFFFYYFRALEYIIYTRLHCTVITALLLEQLGLGLGPELNRGRIFKSGGFFNYIFSPRTGRGLSVFCAPIGFRAGQKKENPIINPISNPITAVYHIYIHVDNSNFTSPIILPLILVLCTLNVFVSALALT